MTPRIDSARGPTAWGWHGEGFHKWLQKWSHRDDYLLLVPAQSVVRCINESKKKKSRRKKAFSRTTSDRQPQQHQQQQQRLQGSGVVGEKGKTVKWGVYPPIKLWLSTLGRPTGAGSGGFFHSRTCLLLEKLTLFSVGRKGPAVMAVSCQIYQTPLTFWGWWTHDVLEQNNGGSLTDTIENRKMQKCSFSSFMERVGKTTVVLGWLWIRVSWLMSRAGWGLCRIMFRLTVTWNAPCSQEMAAMNKKWKKFEGS